MKRNNDDEKLLVQHANGHISIHTAAMADKLSRKNKGNRVFLLAPDDVMNIDTDNSDEKGGSEDE